MSCPALKLHPYQSAVAAYLVRHPGQKGLYVDFATGTGKTLTAVNVAESLLRAGTAQNIRVITPKSLVGNFKKDVMKCIGSNRVPSSYQIWSYDEFRLKSHKIPPHTLLMVDEVHNLRTASGKRVKAILSAAQKAERVLLLSATPFVNGISDISVPMRMILPKSMWVHFPTDQQTMVQRYEGRDTEYVRRMKNMIAYYHEDTGLKPKVVEHVKTVTLTKAQQRELKNVAEKKLSPALRKMLREALKKGNVDVLKRFNAFLTRTRQISNTLDPTTCQSKCEQVAKVLKKGPKPALVYSNFKAWGIEAVAYCLRNSGLRMVVFTGQLSKTKRDQIVKDYNSGKIDVLLFTAAGAEGISLKATRQIHILEPHWNLGRIQQAMGRGVRLDSHGHLPKSQRKVDVYHWISTGKMKDVIIPDIHIYQMAREKQQMIDHFEELNKKASIPLNITLPADLKKELSKTKPPKRPRTKKSIKNRCKSRRPPCPSTCRTVKSHCRKVKNSTFHVSGCPRGRTRVKSYCAGA